MKQIFTEPFYFAYSSLMWNTEKPTRQLAEIQNLIQETMKYNGYALPRNLKPWNQEIYFGWDNEPIRINNPRYNIGQPYITYNEYADKFLNTKTNEDGSRHITNNTFIMICPQ